MNSEENRLRTFSNYPANAVVDPARMAKAGFYHTGMGQEVQCFLCGTKISQWNYGDQAMARHRQASPSCPFVVNPADTCNIPLIRTNDSSYAAGSSFVVQSRNPREEYRTMAQRLRSFVNWPISSFLPPERLAKYGLYYLQKGDMVECAFCRGVLMNWQPGDDPESEHIIHFPSCDFYLHQEAEEVSSSSDKVELNNVKLLPGTRNDLNDLGIQAHNAPRHPKHSTCEGRLRTFEGWPENLKQTPEMLADAGFYYIGVGDQVKCFHCDGGLRNWEVTDDAWTEHARWFPRCGFVNLVRGQDFIKHCIANRPPLDPSILVGVADDGEDVVGSTPPPPPPLPPPPTSTVSPPEIQEVTEAMLEELLNTPLARAALEIGLHVGRVKMALKRRMEATGVPYANADQLIEDVLNEQFLEDDDNRMENHSPDSPSSELSQLLNEIISPQPSNSDVAEASNSDNDNDVRVVIGQESSENDKSHPLVRAFDKDTKNIAVTNKKSAKSDETLLLEEENRRLKEARLCKICMDREVAVVFLPCGHLATCVHCAPSLTHCPMCRQEIRATVRTFLA